MPRSKVTTHLTASIRWPGANPSPLCNPIGGPKAKRNGVDWNQFTDRDKADVSRISLLIVCFAVVAFLTVFFALKAVTKGDDAP
jgi:hypothetical protein